MQIEVRGAMHDADDEVKRDQDHAETFNWSADILVRQRAEHVKSLPQIGPLNIRAAQAIFALRVQADRDVRASLKVPMRSFI
jgi:hypothetical protein